MDQFILTVFLALFVIQFAIEFGLNELNLRQVEKSFAKNVIPEAFHGKIAPQDYARSIEYTLSKARFQRWSEFYGSAVLLIVLLSGLLGVVDQWSAQWAANFSLGSYGQGIIFCGAVGAILTLTALPTELYSTFGIEAKFGFNKTTVGLYLGDKLKGLGLRFVIRRAIFTGGVVVNGHRRAGLVALGFCFYRGISIVDDRDFPDLHCALVQ